jgi:hypothetical protein
MGPPLLLELELELLELELLELLEPELEPPPPPLPLPLPLPGLASLPPHATSDIARSAIRPEPIFMKCPFSRLMTF